MRPTTLAWILSPLSVAAMFVALHVSRHAEARGEGVVWDDEAFAFVRRLVADTYVDEVDERQSREAYNAAIDGYVHSLPDDYNDFIPPEEYRKWLDDTAGHYAGVGVKIKVLEGKGILIQGVFPGGPASRAGVRIGEIVTHVNGVALGTTDLTREENVRVLKGPAGSSVTVTLETPAPADAPKGTLATVRSVAITRGDIRPPSVFAHRIGKDKSVGYVRIEEFVEATVPDFDQALDALVAAGVRAVVVDLRGNGGGVLPATVHIADRFVRDGDIVRMMGRTRGSRRTEVARDAGTIPDAIGLVVLVDGRTASASEVFSGCIQDHRRGVILGTRTYGKFLVQNITEIPGRGAAVKLTTARYMTPNGRSYARDPKKPDEPAGLLPDVVVEMSEADRVRLTMAFENQEEAVWGAPPLHPEVPADWVDPQLQKALDLIAGNLLLQEIRGGAAPGTDRNG